MKKCVAAPGGSGVVYFSPAASHNVSFDERSAIIDGVPTLMLSGAILPCPLMRTLL